eukprot:m.47048 g.47048  ORF g.47048 m.47048 type:complete len:85 (+) comp10953_c0_seq1:1315-1569(+)
MLATAPNVSKAVTPINTSLVLIQRFLPPQDSGGSRDPSTCTLAESIFIAAYNVLAKAQAMNNNILQLLMKSTATCHWHGGCIGY